MCVMLYMVAEISNWQICTQVLHVTWIHATPYSRIVLLCKCFFLGAEFGQKYQDFELQRFWVQMLQYIQTLSSHWCSTAIGRWHCTGLSLDQMSQNKFYSMWEWPLKRERKWASHQLYEWAINTINGLRVIDAFICL